MTVVALTSAKGSPGATLTAMALAKAWRGGAALADVDPAGGDLAWRARDRGGNPLDPDRGLLSLAAAARRGAGDVALADHLQETALGVPTLVGVPSPEQLTGLGAVWSQLAEIFGAHPSDVVVDCGRVVPGSPALPVLLKADVVLFVARPDLEGVAHLRSRLSSLRGPLHLGDIGGPPVGVVVATSYRDTAAVSELQQLLDSERLGVRVLGIAAEDPKGAQMYSSTRVGNVTKSLLGRSAGSLVDQLAQAVPTPTGRR